jgi:ATP synthase protein I
MAGSNGPGETGKTGPVGQSRPGSSDEDLERRRRDLAATLAARRPTRQEGNESAGSRGAAGYGQAFKLSSEFIAGIAVGAGLGWVIDKVAGTSPWGLIVFLLLGFGAGILNVLRSAGMVAEAGLKVPEKGGKKPDMK